MTTMLMVAESYTIESKTPNGSMFVTILEDDSGRPAEILIHAGKNGNAVHAWSTTFAVMLTNLLKSGSGINDLVTILSGITTAEQVSRQLDGSIVRSGPEGIHYAFMVYKRIKYKQLLSVLNGQEDDDYDTGYRPPTMDRRKA